MSTRPETVFPVWIWAEEHVAAIQLLVSTEDTMFRARMFPEQIAFLEAEFDCTIKKIAIVNLDNVVWSK